jgi:hypothetical protein
MKGNPLTAHTTPEANRDDLESVLTSFDTAFSWNYQGAKEDLRDLYEKAKQDQWNATEQLDWSIHVEPESEIVPNALSTLGLRALREAAGQGSRALPARHDLSHAFAVSARRAGRHDHRITARRCDALDRRQVLREHADHGRGAPRRFADYQTDAEAPPVCGIQIVDVLAGAFAFGAIQTALLNAEKTRRGERIDLSLGESILAVTTGDLQAAQAPSPVRLPSYPPIRAKDDFVTIPIISPRAFETLSDLIDPGWKWTCRGCAVSPVGTEGQAGDKGSR